MKPEEVLLKRAEDELVSAKEYIEHVDGLLPLAVKAYTKVKLFGVKETLKDLKNFNDKRIFIDHSDIFAKDYEHKELMRTVQGTLNTMSKYLEWQEDNLKAVSVGDVQKAHLHTSQQVAQALVKVRDWNEKGAHWNDTPEEIKTPQPLDIDKQAEIKTAYGSILVIGKDQKELTEEKTESIQYKHLGYCHECDAATWRIKVEEIGAMPRRDVCMPKYECEDCAQGLREIRERNEYVNRNLISGTSSNLF